MLTIRCMFYKGFTIHRIEDLEMDCKIFLYYTPFEPHGIFRSGEMEARPPVPRPTSGKTPLERDRAVFPGEVEWLREH